MSLAKDLQNFFKEAQHNRHLIEDYGDDFVERARHLDDLAALFEDAKSDCDWCAEKDWCRAENILKKVMEDGRSI